MHNIERKNQKAKNIIKNAYNNNINDVISQKTIPDERLIYCIQKLGLTKYYSNFLQNNLNFEEFLALTNEDMSKMRIPKNIQQFVQKFIMDYLNFGNLYALEEIKNFFRRKKQNNEYFKQSIYQSDNSCYKEIKEYNNQIKQKSIINFNNYISYPKKIFSNNNSHKNRIKLNNQNYYKSFSVPKRNYINFKNLKKENNNNLKEKEHCSLNHELMKHKDKNDNNNNANINNNYLNYYIDTYDFNSTYNNYMNTDIYLDIDEINNLNQNRLLSHRNNNLSHNYTDNYLDNNYQHHCDNYFQNNVINEYNILNLKNSNKNFYTKNFQENKTTSDFKRTINNKNNLSSYNKRGYLNINDYNNRNKKSKSETRNKIHCNINNKPLLSEGNSGMIMNNLNNYFIYNNYGNEDYSDDTEKNINIKIVNNYKNKDYLNKFMRQNNIKIQKRNSHSNDIINNKKKINNQKTINKTDIDYYQRNNNYINKTKINKSALNKNPVTNNQINYFLKHQKQKPNNNNFIFNQKNNLNQYNNMNINSRNINHYEVFNVTNYTDCYEKNNYNLQINNLRKKYDKQNRHNKAIQLPIKNFSSIYEKNSEYSFINPNKNNIYKKVRQFNIKQMTNNSNNKYLKANSTRNLKETPEKKRDNKSKLELLKFEINKLYNKMQMNNIINSNNNIYKNNSGYQKKYVKNNFSKSYNNLYDNDKDIYIN